MARNVQIPESLFMDLCRYLLFGADDTDIIESCKQGLNDKLDKLCMHDLYSKYKDKTLTLAEREQARQQYLDAKGISENFRMPANHISSEK